MAPATPPARVALPSAPRARTPHLLPLSCLDSAPAPPFSGSLHLAFCRLPLRPRVSRKSRNSQVPLALAPSQVGAGRTREGTPAAGLGRVEAPGALGGGEAGGPLELELRIPKSRTPASRAQVRFVPHLRRGMLQHPAPGFSQDQTRWERSQGRKDAGLHPLSAAPPKLFLWGPECSDPRLRLRRRGGRPFPTRPSPPLLVLCTPYIQ